MSKIIYHIHHIIPRHAGGSDEPSNLIRLTIEQHAEAHRLLWEQYGRLEDKFAWLGLAGLTDEAAIVGQKLANKAKKRADVRSKMSAAKKEHWNDFEYRQKMQRIRSTKEYKKKLSDAALQRSDEFKQNLSQISKILWQETVFREKQRNGFSVSVRENMRRKAKARWADPKYRAKMIESQRKRRLREKSET